MSTDKIYIAETIPIKDLKSLLRCLYARNELGELKWAANPTYLDKECTKMECLGYRRSFEDILKLARTYFPETTEDDLMRALVDFGMRCIYCNDVRKIVFQALGGSTLSVSHLNTFIHNSWREGTYKASDLAKILERVERNEQNQLQSN